MLNVMPGMGKFRHPQFGITDQPHAARLQAWSACPLLIPRGSFQGSHIHAKRDLRLAMHSNC
jgi:hypothetical protein